MARGIIRKPSFWKIVGAYRSQWKRTLRRMFIPGYGKRGMGWWRNPKKAWYNWWYHRTSISLYRIFGCKPSRSSMLFAMVIASFANIFAAPVDVAKASVRAHKIRKARKARAERTASRTNGTKRSTQASPQSNQQRTASTYNTSAKPKTKANSASSKNKTTFNSNRRKTTTRHSAATITNTKSEDKPKQTYQYSFSSLIIKNEPVVSTPQPEPEPTKEPDENTPKSKPKNEKDQYIRKRMFIAGSSYCEADVLAKLKVGTYIELQAEPDNPHDKDAVKLTLDGEKIGYIAKADRLPFVTCLKLKRKVYGVITDIITESFPTKYEFETWFDQSK